MCMVGLMSSSEEGMPGLRKYGKVRTKKRKLRAARQLLDYLDRELVELDLVAATGLSNGIYARWACEAINRIRPKIGAEWNVEGSTPISLSWNGNVYPRSNVLGISLYAGMLPIIALRAKTRLEHSEQHVRHVKVCLDNLPLDAEAGSLLLNEFSKDDDIMAMWRENMRSGFTFETGILQSYVDKHGDTQRGKNHPCALLVDWMAQSCMATIAPEQFQAERKEEPFTDSEVEEIAALWEAVDKQACGWAQIIDLDDQDYMKKVAEAWKLRGEKLSD